MQNNLLEYYSRRAKEYESIYLKPERQKDLQILQTKIQDYFTGENVLEIACGTGYFTQFLAQTAGSVLATDFSAEVLEIAKSKNLDSQKITFQEADIYQLTSLGNKFNALFGGFIWSHIPLQKLGDFIHSIHSVLNPGAKACFTDNLYVSGSSTPVFRKDEYGNTYQNRKLKDGTEHMVLKNFPEESFIYNLLKDKVTDLRFEKLEYFWILTYRLK